MPDLEGAVAEPEVESGLDLGELETETNEPAVETEVSVGETETAASETKPGEQETTQQELVEPGFEKLPKQYKDDKFVKGLFHANAELRKTYAGGVREAIALKQQIDSLGGTEVLADFETQRAGWAQIDKDFAEGNPAVLDDMIGESPEGFAKLIGPALDKLFEVDKDAYNHSLGKIFWNTLDRSGVINDLRNMEAALGRKDVDAAVAELARIGAFMQAINGYATKVPEKKAADPDREKFQQEKTEWEQQKQREFTTGVLGETRTYAIGKIEAQLVKEFSSRNLSLAKLKNSDPESYNILLRNCYQALNAKLDEDKDAFKRFSAAVSGGKREDALRLAKSRVDAAFSDAVSRTYKAFYRVAGGKVQPSAATSQQPPPQNGQQARPNNGAVKLTKVPEAEHLDKLRMYREFGKDKTDSMIYRGQGYLKGKTGLYDWS